ncbi:hypothetical protein WR25_04496 [Diploscapter pachys]|uniref:WD repeat-containing protein 44 n=1 Tax=Diploscapter pachys TaxID=2018661 RepID=A0A2A2LG84_9BILA|nr:hypothetical protein WR25_04496 [Diploscapter pachys]
MSQEEDGDDEFEDALDPEEVLKKKPGISTTAFTPARKVEQEENGTGFKQGRVLTSTPRKPFGANQETEHQFAVPRTPHLPDSAASRRERVSALRKRMNLEFGMREQTPVISSSMADAADTMSVASEATSLHSWHRRVLNGPDNLVVQPSDSMSTRAASTIGPPPSMFSPMSNASNWNSPINPKDQWNIDEVDEPECYYSPVTHIEAVSPGPSTSSIGIAPVPMPRSALSPLIHPLPISSYVTPPPLPPRNPTLRLPDPVNVSQTGLEEKLSDDQLRKHSAESVTESVKRVDARTSSDSVSSHDFSGTRRKGHAKTNSLDRGLTLAKVIKSGPFPPPASSKSNSLTRQGDVNGQANGYEGESEGEEDKRIGAAQGIIRQITTGLDDEQGNHEPAMTSATLDVIASSSAESTSSSGKSNQNKLNKSGTTSKNSLEGSVPKIPKRQDSSDSRPKAATLPNIGNTVRPPEFLTIMDPTLSASRSHEFVATPPLVVTAPIDPITRDVERRMSMKRDIDHNNDDTHSERGSTVSSLEHAKSLARNYGNYASTLLRGAFQKVRTKVGHSSNATKEEITSDSEGEQSDGGANGVEQPTTSGSTPGSIVRPRKAKKGPFDFENLRLYQELSNEHTGAVWCVRFSVCGRLLATAGQDAILRVWVVKSHLRYFTDMRERYQQKTDACRSASDVFEATIGDLERPPSSAESQAMSGQTTNEQEDEEENSSGNVKSLFCTKPFAIFKGHTADIMDVSLSKNYFILSSGMDRTVKLWHLSRSECLCCFQHVDIVTCVAFLPKDDRYFISGSLDGKLRLWHIPDKRVAVWNEIQVKFITALAFVKGGKFVVVGTYTGRCYFYTTEQLKYHTVVDVRSSRGKNAKGHKITGLAVHGDKLLVTSNDSRIRMYDVRDKSLACKFRGATNEHSHIRAAFSHDGKHIICGSEDKFVYIWRTSDLPSTLSVRKDLNNMWERIRAHTALVSVAVFAPKPQIFLSMLEPKSNAVERQMSVSHQPATGHAIVSADRNGCIKVFVNRPPEMKTGQSLFYSQD